MSKLTETSFGLEKDDEIVVKIVATNSLGLSAFADVKETGAKVKIILPSKIAPPEVRYLGGEKNS